VVSWFGDEDHSSVNVVWVHFEFGCLKTSSFWVIDKVVFVEYAVMKIWYKDRESTRLYILSYENI
jgi:hypothetical protein